MACTPGTIGLREFLFLTAFASIVAPQRAIEIGTLAGFSAAVIAAALHRRHPDRKGCFVDTIDRNMPIIWCGVAVCRVAFSQDQQCKYRRRSNAQRKNRHYPDGVTINEAAIRNERRQSSQDSTRPVRECRGAALSGQSPYVRSLDLWASLIIVDFAASHALQVINAKLYSVIYRLAIFRQLLFCADDFAHFTLRQSGSPRG